MEIHRCCGNIIRKTKTISSNRCAFFTEEVLRYNKFAIGNGKSPWERHNNHNYGVGVHIDTIKLRLLSPFGIQSLMGDSSYRNPAIGKASALANVSRWFPNKGMLNVAHHRFNRWMADAIGGHVSCFLPRWMGGYGFPWLKSREELLMEFQKQLHPAIYKIFSIKTDVGRDYHSVIDFLVRRMATGNLVRGLLDPMPYLISAQYANLAVTAWADKCKSFGQIASELQSKKTYEVRSKDIIRYARTTGLMPYHDIVDSLDRLTAIRIAMLVAEGSLDLEDILPTRQTKLPNPNEVLENFFENEIGYFNAASFDRSDLTPDLKSTREFYSWVEEGMPDCPISNKQVFIPKAALVDSLAGMSIPLPYVAPPVVKGSSADPDVALIKGYIAKMVSLRRTKRF
jgi:hypothetical protein